jgi:UPF0755 protein
MKRRSRRLLFGLAALVLLAGAAAGAALYVFHRPYRAFEGERIIEINRGLSSREMARQLKEAGVIEREWAFLVRRALHPKEVLQAGEYRFNEAASLSQVFDRLIRGDIVFFEVTIPEGSNIWEIARLLETQGIMSEEEFLRAAANPALIRDLAPQAQSLEGYLFPSTYRVSHSTTAEELCRMMVEEFRKQWGRVNDGTASRVHQAVTLASLVEEETGVPDERGLVAAVFANRLRVGMRLACDPTVIYAARLVKKYRGTIYQSDLERDHPYNTYRRDGLPPGPISSPGAAALAAALRPAAADYLYFVAKPGGGGHVFSATSAAHQKAVRNYRNGIAAQQVSRKTR